MRPRETPFVTWGHQSGQGGAAGRVGARTGGVRRRVRPGGCRRRPWPTWVSGRHAAARHQRSTRCSWARVTNGRIEDLRAAAAVIQGRRRPPMVCECSSSRGQCGYARAEAERRAGCDLHARPAPSRRSGRLFRLCLGMTRTSWRPASAAPRRPTATSELDVKARVASTHLVSPLVGSGPPPLPVNWPARPTSRSPTWNKFTVHNRGGPCRLRRGQRRHRTESSRAEYLQCGSPASGFEDGLLQRLGVTG
jgi:hypothetical protein